MVGAPRSRVWQAISDRGEFGTWFPVNFHGAGTFVAGEKATGQIAHPGYEHLKMELGRPKR
jgi:hypothetical protein